MAFLIFKINKKQQFIIIYLEGGALLLDLWCAVAYYSKV
jgi:hypothetical protein